MAADLSALTQEFAAHFNDYYIPRFCGRTIMRFIDESQKKNIDLSGAYVLMIEDSGFWGTNAFFGREVIDDRRPLGDFHIVLVAEGKVFDFDLHRPIVLPVEDYFRLQFTPPKDPYYLYPEKKEGLFNTVSELSYLKLSRIELVDFPKPGKPIRAWTKTLHDAYDVDAIMKRKRLDIVLKHCQDRFAGNRAIQGRYPNRTRSPDGYSAIA